MTGDDEAEAKHVHCQGRENQNRFLEVGPPDQFSTARSPVSLSVSPAPLDTIDARSPLLSASSAVHLSRRPVPCIHCKIIRRRCDLVKPHCGRCIERGLECSWTSQTLEPLDRPPKLSPKPSLLEPPNVMSIASLIDDSDIPSIPVVTVSFGETMNQDNLSMNSCTGCRTLKRKCSRMIPECGQCKSRGVPCMYDRISQTEPIQPSISNISSSNNSSDAFDPISPIIPKPKNTEPCRGCRDQKKRCDGKRPSCGYCLRRNAVCEYVAPGPRTYIRRKPREPTLRETVELYCFSCQKSFKSLGGIQYHLTQSKSCLARKNLVVDD